MSRLTSIHELLFNCLDRLTVLSDQLLGTRAISERLCGYSGRQEVPVRATETGRYAELYFASNNIVYYNMY